MSQCFCAVFRVSSSEFEVQTLPERGGVTSATTTKERFGLETVNLKLVTSNAKRETPSLFVGPEFFQHRKIFERSDIAGNGAAGGNFTQQTAHNFS